MMRWLWIAAMTSIVPFSSPAQAAETAADKLLAKIKAIGPEGAGNAEAGAAWQALVGQGEKAFFPTLMAMDGAKPIAVNWLRTAAEAIFQNQKQAKKPIPAAELEAFVQDKKYAPIPRRVAYELLAATDPTAPARLLPAMIEDPSIDIRRDAIAAAIEKTAPLVKAQPAAAKKELKKLFEASRDQDQAEQLAKQLKELEVPADLTAHFGVVTRWHLIGPFDSTKGAGFARSHEPEKKVDLQATHEGKDGAKLAWKEYVATDTYAVVDLNTILGKFKDSVAYAYTVVQSETELPVEIRLGSTAAVKVFVNGKEIFGREEYHHGNRFDQYTGNATLKPGKNEILLKVCQNNQTENWAQDWKFQMRICDGLGGQAPVKAVEGK